MVRIVLPKPLDAEKSFLAQWLEEKLKERQQAKIDYRNNPLLYGKFLNSLSDEVRWLRQHRMYQLSGAMNSRDLVRFDPHAHGVANGH